MKKAKWDGHAEVWCETNKRRGTKGCGTKKRLSDAEARVLIDRKDDPKCSRCGQVASLVFPNLLGDIFG